MSFSNTCKPCSPILWHWLLLSFTKRQTRSTNCTLNKTDASVQKVVLNVPTKFCALTKFSGTTECRVMNQKHWGKVLEISKSWMYHFSIEIKLQISQASQPASLCPTEMYHRPWHWATQNTAIFIYPSLTDSCDFFFYACTILVKSEFQFNFNTNRQVEMLYLNITHVTIVRSAKLLKILKAIKCLFVCS